MNAFDPHEVSELQPMLHRLSDVHRGFVFAALHATSETEALREVRLRQYHAKVAAMRQAMIELRELQIRILEEENVSRPEVIAAVEDLLKP